MQRRNAPLLPLRDIIVFPHQTIPLFVGRQRSIAAIERANAEGKELILAAQKTAAINSPSPDDIYEIGTLVTIVQLIRLPDETVKVLVEGKERASIAAWLEQIPQFIVEYEVLQTQDQDHPDIFKFVDSIKTKFEQYTKVNKQIPPEARSTVAALNEPNHLADTIVGYLDFHFSDKQKMLETTSLLERLSVIEDFIRTDIEAFEIARKSRLKSGRRTGDRSKEFFLNEHMQAIQKELGDRDELKSEIQELEERIAQKNLPIAAEAKAYQELKRLKHMAPMSAEATVLRNYIDWILALPWTETSTDIQDINYAESILDRDHYGLEKVKERILEHLAIQAAVSRPRGPILCLVGPPGVGKTSLGRSIAHAMERKFVKMSLGGVRDEAEIRGHRRTYIGAMPGKLLQNLKRAGTSNPVFMLDEIDKMSVDFRGDPSSALLEVLDPEQNSAFNDHYLDLDYDLSNVLFVATANNHTTIPRPLLDRMEIIRLEGYTEEEKQSIARRYLIPKQSEFHGLSADTLEFEDDDLAHVIRSYTREAGVRGLEREIASLCRKIIRKILQGTPRAPLKLTPDRIEEFLGKPKFKQTKVEPSNEVGLATGLAWTETGGEILHTEVTILPGRGKLILTGTLGDVMRESAQAAMSYVRARAETFGIERNFYSKVDVHVHVPDGAMPKDGPSAGITIATALSSALMRIPIYNDVAMTGEITLRGRVLPIGGLKEKVLAARRNGIKKVLIPIDNVRDIADLPKSTQGDIELIAVSHMDEILSHALVLESPETFLQQLKRPSSLQTMPSPPAIAQH